MRSFADREVLLASSDLEITVPQRMESQDWASCFGAATTDDNASDEEGRFVLEIGVGKDPHLVTRSKDFPNDKHLAFEYSRKKLLTFLTKAHDEQLTNLRGMQADFKRVLPAFFADESIDQTYIFFPDPWPKKRHRKKRMVQPETMDLLAQKIKKGGKLELRTDDRDYAEQMLEVMEACKFFRNELDRPEWSPSPRDPGNHRPTLFEMRFMKINKPLHYFYYEKI